MDADLINEDLAPVQPEQRNWTRWNIAALWVGMAICIPTYTLASSLVEQGWSWQASLCAVALGNVIVLVPMLLNAHAGTAYGIPFPVLLRSSFGVFGANIPAMMRAFVACGWFGIQTWVGGFALYQLFGVIFPDSPNLPQILPSFFGITTGEFIAFLLFWALNVWIIWRGIDSIRVLQTWSAPFLLVIGLLLFVWAWVQVGSLDQLFDTHIPVTRSFWSAMFGVGISSGVAFWGTLALNIPDFSRFAKTQRDQIVGQSIGLVPTMTFFAFIGAIVTNATGFIFGMRIADPVALMSRVGGPVVTVLAMLGIALATLTTNLAANIVSPANDFSNLSPRRISFRTGALIAASLGILIMPWKLYRDGGQYLFTWLMGYGSLLGAIAGIMLVDYFWIRKKQLLIQDLYKRKGAYSYVGGVNYWAVLALFLGILPNLPGFLMAVGLLESVPVWQAIYDRGWFVGLFVSGASYGLFSAYAAMLKSQSDN